MARRLNRMTLGLLGSAVVERAKAVYRRLCRWGCRAGYRFIVPPGHYYSPIPSMDEVRRQEARIFGSPPRSLPALDLREQEQLALVESFAPHYAQMPFSAAGTEGCRYRFENPAYTYGDAIFLYCMMRRFRPARIVEVGSGWSSCAMLDVNDRFFEGAIHIDCIEPAPGALLRRLRHGDTQGFALTRQPLQDVPLSLFASLAPGDFLVVDSTHVSKVGSDVNHLFFEVLPAISPGVFVHFHDVFYPFEYPRSWVYEGRAWNEAYMLRAFLEYNDAFEVVLWNSYLAAFHDEALARALPLALRNPGGSLWVRKTQRASSG